MFLKRDLAFKLLFALALIFPHPHSSMADISLTPSISFEEGYDTNVFSSGVGKESEDFISTVDPELSLSYSRPRFELGMVYNAGFTFYSRNHKFNTVKHSAAFTLDTTVTKRTKLSVSDTFTYTPQTIDIKLIAGQNLQGGFTDTYYNDASITLDRKITQKHTFSISVDDTVLEFTDPAFVDSRTDKVHLELSYRATPKLTITPSYDYTAYAFARGDLGTSELHMGSVSFHAEPWRSIALDLAGGAGALEGDMQWTARGGVSKSFRHTTINASYSRSFLTAAGLANKVTKNNVYTLSFTTALSDRLNVSLTGTYSENKTTPAALDVNAYSSDISVTWKLFQRIQVLLGYNRFRQWDRTSGNANDIVRDRVYLRIVVTGRVRKL